MIDFEKGKRVQDRIKKLEEQIKDLEDLNIASVSNPKFAFRRKSRSYDDEFPLDDDFSRTVINYLITDYRIRIRTNKLTLEKMLKEEL